MAERWIVDAMNVIGSRPDRWWNDPDAAMRSFAESVDAYAATFEHPVTVVFDKDPGHLPDTSHATLVTSKFRGRNAADHEIVRIVEEAEDPSALRVVTSDRALADRVTALGARVISSGSFRKQLDR